MVLDVSVSVADEEVLVVGDMDADVVRVVGSNGFGVNTEAILAGKGY